MTGRAKAESGYQHIYAQLTGLTFHQSSLEFKLHLHLKFDLDLHLEYQMCAKYTPQLNDLVLFACHASRSSQNQT